MCFGKTASFFEKNPEKLTPEGIKKYTGLAGRNLGAVFDRHGPMITKRPSEHFFLQLYNFLADPRPPYFMFFLCFSDLKPTFSKPNI